MLREIAGLTDAKFYLATDTEGLRDIYAEINALEKSEVEVLVFTRYQEVIAWFLVPALALLLLQFVLSRTVFRRFALGTRDLRSAPNFSTFWPCSPPWGLRVVGPDTAGHSD